MNGVWEGGCIILYNCFDISFEVEWEIWEITEIADSFRWMSLSAEKKDVGWRSGCIILYTFTLYLLLRLETYEIIEIMRKRWQLSPGVKWMFRWPFLITFPD